MDENQFKLRCLMMQSGLRSKDVAEILSRHEVTVRKYMTGKRNVSDHLISVLESAISNLDDKVVLNG